MRFVLEEWRDTLWVPVYHPVCVTGRGGLREIRPGTSLRSPVPIHQRPSSDLFSFEFPRSPRTYRLVFALYEAPLRSGEGIGSPLPLIERASNLFIIAPHANEP